MFKFIVNYDQEFYDGFETNQLEIVNCQVRNVFYGMNSLFNMTQHGGRLHVTDSIFETINICGSIVKNKYFQGNNIDLGSITTAYLSRAEKDFIKQSQ